MLIVAVDTSGRKGSVALCRGDGHSCEALALTALEGGTYSARLMPSIAEMLEAQAVAKSEVDGFVVVDGPGSFTGLRVGIATVKALCQALRKPLAAVSMLEALALREGPGRVASILDAGRGEVYLGEYEVAGMRADPVRQSIARLDLIVQQLPDAGEPSIVTPEAKVAEVLKASGVNVKVVAAVQAGEIGRIGLRRLLAGETVDPATLDANYIRRSDAELFAPRR